MVKEFIYPFIIRYEDGVYYANSTDIDECFTDGDSIQEVISNINDVLEAMEKGVNFSKILQDALIEYLK